MFCARCGIENPDDGKFCRKCGGRIGLIEEDDDASSSDSDLSSAHSARQARYSAGARKFIWGLFLLIAGVFLGIPLKGTQYSDLALLPGALLVVWAMADFIRLRVGSSLSRNTVINQQTTDLDDGEMAALPPEKTLFAEDEISRTYETGDMAPASVTERTTRKLAIDSGKLIDELGEND